VVVIDAKPFFETLAANTANAALLGEQCVVIDRSPIE
jgi:hypothetical protein